MQQQQSQLQQQQSNLQQQLEWLNPIKKLLGGAFIAFGVVMLVMLGLRIRNNLKPNRGLRENDTPEVAEARKCEQCGYQLNKWSSVCAYCGTKAPNYVAEQSPTLSKPPVRWFISDILSIICWIAMPAVVIVIIVRFGNQNFLAFIMHDVIRAVLNFACPIALLVGAFVSIYKGQRALMVYPMFFYLVLRILSTSFSFSIPAFAISVTVAVVTYVFYMSSNEQTNTGLVTSTSIMCAIISFLVILGTQVIGGRSAFSVILSAYQWLFTLLFFAGTAFLGKSCSMEKKINIEIR